MRCHSLSNYEIVPLLKCLLLSTSLLVSAKSFQLRRDNFGIKKAELNPKNECLIVSFVFSQKVC